MAAMEETKVHIQRVVSLISFVMGRLAQRCAYHDRSKFGPEEFPGFAEFTSKLRGSTYGSAEYKKFLEQLKPTLDHHYSVNRHHPEHFGNGIRGMNLIDIVEMFCDWYAAVERHDTGDIEQSIEINQKRFGFSDDLREIFLNTAKLFFAKEL